MKPLKTALLLSSCLLMGCSNTETAKTTETVSNEIETVETTESVETVETTESVETVETVEKLVPSEIRTLGIQSETEIYYPLLMVATEVNAENIVTAEDREGNLWEFESDDAFTGDLYMCIMTDNGTPEDITDDEIVTLRYAGDIFNYATESVIDMENVVGYEATETGLYLQFEDENYYWGD